MTTQITNVIAMDPVEAGQAVTAATPSAVLNRAAWPDGSMLVCAIVSHRFGHSITYCPAIDAVEDRAPAAA
jgi:hypothetical protein